MTKLFCIVSMFIFCSACSKNETIYKKLIQVTDAYEQTADINMLNLTDFKWDTLYLFRYDASKNEVFKATGLNISNFSEFTKKIIFTIDGKLAYYEEFPTNLSGVSENEIIFNLTSKYELHDASSSMFIIKKEKITKDKYYYDLMKK